MVRIRVDVGDKDEMIVSGDIPEDWILAQCEMFRKTGQTDARAFLFDDGNIYTVKIPQFQTASFDCPIGKNLVRRLFLEERQDLWDSMLAYNRAFLRGEFLGTFYHAGPVLLDQSSKQLETINYFMFTMDGQGRLRKIGKSQGPGIVMYPSVEEVLPLRLTPRILSYYSKAREGVVSLQKAYIEGFMFLGDFLDMSDNFRALDMNVYAFDETNTYIAKGPERDTVTYGNGNTVQHLDDRHRSYKSQLSLLQDFLGNLAEYLPNLVFISIWEKDFDETGPSLLDRVESLFI